MEKNRNLIKLKDKLSTLEQIIDLLPGNAYWKNADGDYLWCNKNTRTTFAAISSNKSLRLLSNKFAKQSHKHELLAIKNGHEIAIEEKGLSLDGKTPAIYWSNKKPLYNRRGKNIGVLGVSLDITKLKQMEKELRQIKKNFELALIAKSALIRSMEHDIRTPLSGAIGLLNMLIMEESSPNKKATLQNIYNCNAELLTYCNDILKLSILEHRNHTLINKPFNILSVFKKLLLLEESAAKTKKIFLSVEYKKIPNVLLIGDEFRLYSILINLVSNAIKFTEKGSVKVCAELLDGKTSRDAILKFSVLDTGAGFSPEEQHFFYQRAEVDDHFLPYSGMGIRIMKKFIAELSGEATINSTHHGTNICCLIPFKKSLSSLVKLKSRS